LYIDGFPRALKSNRSVGRHCFPHLRRNHFFLQLFLRLAGSAYLVTTINHLHQKVRTSMGLPKDFVIHSLRHTMLTRLGESGVDAFTIMRIAGHSNIVVSQRYVHPSPEGVERAFQRLQALSASQTPNELAPATIVATPLALASVNH
jgi:integrase